MTDAEKKHLSEYWKGKKKSPEHTENIRRAKLGSKNPNYGKKLSEEHALALGLSRKGKPSWNKGKKCPELATNWKGGKPHCLECGKLLSSYTAKRCKNCWFFSEETLKKMSDMHKGEKSHLWKGGITPTNTKIRNSKEYRMWRKTVFERDNYTCVFCGKRGGEINADHIKPFALYPKLRLKLSNGRTLCEPCHKQTPSYLNRWALV